MKNKTVLIITTLLLLSLGAVCTGFYLYNKKPADLRESKPDVIIECVDLLNQYDNDSEKADSAFMNKIIQVEGTVVGISTDPNGVTSINLSDEQHALMVSCEMNHLILVFLSAATLLMPAEQAGKYFTRSGNVSFNCGTSLEKIEGINHKAASVLDASTGQLEFTVLIKAFMFDRALMGDHFNENYMESDKFPKAVFKGTIQNNSTVDYTKNGTYKVVVSGDLTIHGVTKPLRTEAELIVKDNKINAKAGFNVTLSDYNIEIPSLVKDKIDKQAKVIVDLLYEPLSK
jgi:hypothetical protein